ncbi:MSEP-CTERM sorting domain-containing protein [Anaeromicrobium sediminis]|uniref:MSEP-CTERM sorting domain-containing protein n=1 Tax=Anaeromicrobium sediminis TaxID=1478221 RepID=UPI001595621E|nr:MSEP-CTERM sorting domain-containing protein [Anaeromicrobium sediminis]
MRKEYKNLLFIGIPLGWYFIASLIMNRLLSPKEIAIGMSLTIITGVIIYTIFSIGKSTYTNIKNKDGLWKKYMSVIILVGAISGLSLNESMDNLFGDFSHPVFYIVTIITCVSLSFVRVLDERIKLILYGIKSITFSFTLYFFIIFVQLLPLAMIGLILFGLGILMIVPIFLMIVHIICLWNDFMSLKIKGGKLSLALIFVIGISVIPASFYMTVKNDRDNFNRAMEYVYERGLEDTKKSEINIGGIKRTLTNIKYIKGLERNDRGKTTIPYITSFYEKNILKNKSISKVKAKKMEQVFLGSKDVSAWEEDYYKENEGIHLENISSETTYDESLKIYKSWIHLEIQNDENWRNEFRTTFNLPEGSFITNYYLYVNNIKKYGLVADKRAANWIYESEKRKRRDPGVLTYGGDNRVLLKIFPFEDRQLRKTGIEIIHKGPITMEFEGRKIKLEGKNNNIEFENGNFAYISALEKDNLERVVRPNKYYFIVNFSKKNKNYKHDHVKAIEIYIEENNLKDRVGEIIGLNYEENIFNYDEFKISKLNGVKNRGGFYLEKSIKRILYENYVKNSTFRPIIVVYSNSIENGVITDSLRDFKFTMPEEMAYYEMDKNNNLIKRYLSDVDFTNRPFKIDEIEKKEVLKWQSKDGRTYYLPDNGKDSIALLNHNINLKDVEVSDLWEKGLLLKSAHMSSTLHPEKYVDSTLNTVKESIKSNIMSHSTSYIVLESKDQEKRMLEKQKQLLEAKSSLELGDIIEMSEPNSILIYVLLVLGLILMRNKRIKN